MARKAGRVDPGGSDALLNDERYGFTGQLLGGDAAMPIDRPEDITLVDPGHRKPMVECDDWAMPGSAVGYANLSTRAFLIGLRAPQGDDDTLPDVLDVCAVKANQFRAAEPARKANKQQRPIPRILHAVAHSVENPKQVLLQQWLSLALGDPPHALEAPQRGADDFRPAWIGQAPGLARLRYRRYTANERGDAERLGVGGEMASNCAWQRS